MVEKIYIKLNKFITFITIICTVGDLLNANLETRGCMYYRMLSYCIVAILLSFYHI